MEFSFSPKFLPSMHGWSHHQGMYCQREYAVFFRFIPVGAGSSRGKSYRRECSEKERERQVRYVPVPSSCPVLEVAVTASAHPVSLSCTPEVGLDFGSTSVGVPHSQHIQLCNNSATLPVSFNCRVPAHYKTSSLQGKIPPNGTTSLEVVFLPHQLGCLDGKLSVDVLGVGRERESVTVDSLAVELRGTGEQSRQQRRGREGKKRRSAQLDDLATSIRPHDKRVDIK